MQHALRTAQILLMADAVPAATKYVLRSIQEYCEARQLALPHVWIMSRQTQPSFQRTTWIPTPPPGNGSRDFQYLAVLKHGLSVIAKDNRDPVEINPLPCFTLSAQDGPMLPVARHQDQRDPCTTCRSDGIKSLTLRALNRAGHTHYEYDLGSPFVVHSKQLVSMALGMQIPYAVETYYNNLHGVMPGSFVDAIRVIAEQRFMGLAPEQLDEAFVNSPLVAFTQNGWNRWIMAWCESRWPTPSRYEFDEITELKESPNE